MRSARWSVPIDPKGLSDDDCRALAKELYHRWSAGEKKSPLEIEYFAKPTSHGKFFSGFIKKWLALGTETKSAQSDHIERLEGLLRVHGVSPTDAGDLAQEYRLVDKCRESALAALRIYNEPVAGFPSETFIVLMIIAWNALLQSILERGGVDYYVRDGTGRVVEISGRGRVKDTSDLIELALPGPQFRPMRCNLDFFLGLRNQIAHRYLPGLDPMIAEEAQSMLLNFERVLTESSGTVASLGETWRFHCNSRDFGTRVARVPCGVPRQHCPLTCPTISHGTARRYPTMFCAAPTMRCASFSFRSRRIGRDLRTHLCTSCRLPSTQNWRPSWSVTSPSSRNRGKSRSPRVTCCVRVRSLASLLSASRSASSRIRIRAVGSTTRCGQLAIQSSRNRLIRSIAAGTVFTRDMGIRRRGLSSLWLSSAHRNLRDRYRHPA